MGAVHLIIKVVLQNSSRHIFLIIYVLSKEFVAHSDGSLRVCSIFNLESECYLFIANIAKGGN